jgi:hypothetical protein
MSILTPATEARGKMAEALEEGRLVYFDKAPIALPSEADLEFLRSEMPRLLKWKNVSFYPEGKRVSGLSEAAAKERVRAILEAHLERVVGFLHEAIAPLTQGWRIGTSSFRPLEERGRNLSAHASNELVHVDAGAYGATHGGSILRFFVNVNPSADRVWATKGTFTDVFRRYGKEAGVSGLDLREKWWDRARTASLGAAAKLVPAAKLIDSSPYDRAMRRLHNYMKDTPAFQASAEGHEEFRFPPGSAWMVMTDRLSHACLSGQHAFVDTFIVPPKAFRLPAIAPLSVLTRAA